jgi:predicted TIM-barrel fold metal-dependent hydrolase
MEIIDAHVHAGKGTAMSGPWDTDAPLDRYLKRAHRAGITRFVLLPAFHEDYRVANRELAKIARSDPRRFIGFAMVHPTRDAGRVSAMIAEAVQSLGFRGIKVHRHDAPITREICEAARRHRLPILYDVMGEAAQVELLAEQYPDVNFIIPHLASFGDDWKAHVLLLDLISRHRNVFTDSAGVRRFDYLVEAVRRAGAQKLLFGSDGPWLHPGLELEKIKLLGLHGGDHELVVGGNLLRLVQGVRA